MPTKTHFHRFDQHTLLKHFLLRVYLKAWADIIVEKFGTAWFVDAFAGEGCDGDGNPGSPLIAAQIAIDINNHFFPNGLSPITGMRVAAFEWQHDRYNRLVEVMKPYTRPTRPWPNTIATVTEGTLEAKLAAVTEFLEKRPTLYFLDPFGIDGLSAAVIPELLAGGQKEVLVLFADIGAVRLAGKARAGAKDEETELEVARSAVPDNLFGEAETASEIEAAVAAKRRELAGHKSNPNADEIMNRAFGGDWWKPIIDATPEDRRREKFVELYEERVLKQSGATHCLHYRVRTPDGKHKYFLIHASKDVRAFAVMKDAMHRTRSQALRASANRPALIDPSDAGDIESDIRLIGDAVVRHFSGQRGVRWTGARGSVQQFVLENTPLWMHERDALKAELTRRRFTRLNDKGRPSRPMTFDFPSSPG